ncbi:hypothetical protein DERF_008187 [Dermatophagoides farinae]|uniref:Uncharacterized protein n=1 Tax=Dermatophagoides farinae TaxID=6954 RepID=A0A922L6Q9_DERFA|nr:hypothetical protein DERF_008187 [Dermatophagoides farinae]
MSTLIKKSENFRCLFMLKCWFLHGIEQSHIQSPYHSPFISTIHFPINHGCTIILLDRSHHWHPYHWSGTISLFGLWAIHSGLRSISVVIHIWYAVIQLTPFAAFALVTINRKNEQGIN